MISPSMKIGMLKSKLTIIIMVMLSINLSILYITASVFWIERANAIIGNKESKIVI